MSQYPVARISDYGLIGDTRTAALVSKYGSIDWGCFPRFDSPSFFGATLDHEKGGHFSLSPAGGFRSHQEYLEDTNIVVTKFETETGVAQILDCFSVTTEARKKKELWPEHEILRFVEGIAGEVYFNITYAPRFDYAKNASDFYQRGCLGISCSCEHHLLLLQSSLAHGVLKIINGEKKVIGQFRVAAGERVQFSLSYASDAPAVIPPLGAPALDRYHETVRFWQTWIGQCNYAGPYAGHVRRSALALKLLSYAPSGAIIAAPTTSLPESIGGVRNWDYRYCWLRDASFTVKALVSLGFYDEANAFVSWMLYATRLTRPKLQVLYSVYGESSLKETVLDWLSGYRGSQPVRIGNGAANQFQLDVYGEVLDGIYHFTPFINEFDSETRNFILDLGKAVCELWDRPDDGIWEVRSGRVHHTHSKVMAWVALDRLVRMAKTYSWSAPIEQYESIKSRLRDEIEDKGYDPKLAAYTRTFGGGELDASLLVMPLVGYCDATSSRIESTYKAICEHLSKNGLIFRYRNVDDGIRGEEGSFGICNFWMAEVLARAGRIEDSTQYFEQLLKWENGVRLWSEEIDPVSGEFLGNYPQAFTHIGLINAALALKEKAGKGITV